MANSNPSPKTRFRLGNNANPSGAGSHDQSFKAIRKLTKSQFTEIADLLLRGTVADLRKSARDPNAPALQAIVSAAMVKIIDKGDMHGLDVLLNRLIGKVKDAPEPLSSGEGPKVIVHLPSNGREARQS